MTLRLRLLLGFLGCAAITALAVGMGIWSLFGVQGRMGLTTNDIGDSIDHQNRHSQQLMQLRKTVAEITRAKTEAKLSYVQKNLPTLKRTDEKELKCDQAQLENRALKKAEELHAHKRKSIQASLAAQSARETLVALQSESERALTEITKIAKNAVYSKEMEAKETIEVALSGVEADVKKGSEDLAKSLDAMSNAMRRATDIIKAALAIRALCNGLDAETKDILLAAQESDVQYHGMEADKAFDAIDTQVALLPAGDATTKLKKLLQNLKKQMHQLVSAKSSERRGNGGEANLASIRAQVAKALAAVNAAATDMVVNTEFDTTIAIEEALSGIKEKAKANSDRTTTRIRSMSEAMETSVGTVRAGLTFRGNCYEINAIVNGVLLAEEPGKVDYAQFKTDQLVENARNQLGAMKKTTLTEKAGKALKKLKSGIDKTLKGKQEMLSAESVKEDAEKKVAELMAAENGEAPHKKPTEGEGEVDVATLPQLMGDLDESMLAGIKGMKTTAKESMRSSQDEVSAWAFLLLLVGLGAVFLALGIGFVVWRSIVNPLVKMREAAREFEKGDFLYRIDYKSQDEVGQMATGLRNIARAQQEKTNAAEAIARGDLTYEVKVHSEKDVLSKAYQTMIGSLSRRAALATAISKGDLSHEVEVLSEKDRFGMALRNMTASLRSRSELAQRIAAGDLSENVEILSDRDVLGQALQRMVESLRSIIGQVGRIATQVAASSREIAEASQTVSSGASEQSASVQETVSATAQMASQTRANATAATQASEQATRAREQAHASNERMSEMKNGLTAINDASGNIQRISKVIDDIAFQTNLLALNAAVEAARAGRHGRGFAVVAEEIRNLAATSAESAREIEELIDTSVNMSQKGQEIASRAADGLQEIIKRVDGLASVVAGVASSSNEQAQQITQVNQGLDHINSVTNTNSSTAEEAASAAKELSSEASHLKQILAHFHLSKSPGGARSEDEPGPLMRPRVHDRPAKSLPQPRNDHVRKPSEKIVLDDEEFGRY